jgi:hypothetical protein
MDLDFQSLYSTALGSLTIDFSDIFGPIITQGVAAGIGGTLANGASLTYNTWQDGTFSVNGIYQNNGTLLTTQSFGPDGPFSGGTGGTDTGEDSAVLTQQIILTQTTGGLTSSGDAALGVPDTTMTLVLLGAGLASLAAFGQFRRVKVGARA